MTNQEYYEKLETMTALAVLMLRDCACDKSKINDGLWEILVKLYKEIEEYL